MEKTPETPAAAAAPAVEAPAVPALPEPAAASPAPGAPTASAAPTAPASPPSPAPSGRPAPDRVRSNVRVAGVMMVLIGALTAFSALPAALGPSVTEDFVRTYADAPGGNVTVEFPQASEARPARLAVTDYNGTEMLNLTLEGASVTVTVPTFASRLEVNWQDRSWSRNVIATPRLMTAVRLDAQESPATDAAWILPDLSAQRTVGIVSIVLAAVLLVAGVMTFRLRARPLALLGAGILAAGGAVLVGLTLLSGGANFTYLLQPLILAAMGVFSFWALRQAKDRFTQVRLGPLTL